MHREGHWHFADTVSGAVRLAEQRLVDIRQQIDVASKQSEYFPNVSAECRTVLLSRQDVTQDVPSSGRSPRNDLSDCSLPRAGGSGIVIR